MPPRPDEEDDGAGYLAHSPEVRSAPGVHLSRHPVHLSEGAKALLGTSPLAKQQQYEDRIPEGLRLRTAQAHERLGLSEVGSDGVPAISPGLDTLFEKAAVEVDFSQAEVCNLGAVAVRNDAVRCLTGAYAKIRDSRPITEWTGSIYGVAERTLGITESSLGEKSNTYSRDFFELYYSEENGRFQANMLTNEQHARVVAFVESTRGLMPQPVYWADVPYQKRRFRRDLLDVNEEALSQLPITVGLHFGGNVFAPLLKNQKTASGCTFVFPDGQELDGDAQNRPEILASLKSLIQAESKEEVGQYSYELLERIRIQAQTKGLSGTEAIIGMIFRPYESLSDLKKTMVRFLNQDTSTEVPEKMVTVKDDPGSAYGTRCAISVCADIKRKVKIGSSTQDMVAYLARSKRFVPELGTYEHSFTLYRGLDEAVYGATAYVTPEYIYVYDRFNDGRLYKPSGIEELLIANEEQTIEFINSVKALTLNTV